MQKSNSLVGFWTIFCHSHLPIAADAATACPYIQQWLNVLVLNVLGIQGQGPGFNSRVVPLFHQVATLGKLFTHTASTVSQLQETWVQKGVFGA